MYISNEEKKEALILVVVYAVAGIVTFAVREAYYWAKNAIIQRRWRKEFEKNPMPGFAWDINNVKFPSTAEETEESKTV